MAIRKADHWIKSFYTSKIVIWRELQFWEAEILDVSLLLECLREKVRFALFTGVVYYRYVTWFSHDHILKFMDFNAYVDFAIFFYQWDKSDNVIYAQNKSFYTF